MSVAGRSQVRVPVPLELELQRVVSHYIDTGNQSLTPYKSSKCSYLLSHFSKPALFFQDRISLKLGHDAVAVAAGQ